MKALSVKQPWASLIAAGLKTIETRTWPTHHRGDLLICSSQSPRYDSLPTGAALAIVKVVDCRPMTSADEAAAGCELYARAFAWVLSDIRPLEQPIPISGRQGLFNVDLEDLRRTVQTSAPHPLSLFQ